MDKTDHLLKQRAFGKQIRRGKNALSLNPKGACWYCNQPLDNVRRFCSKACANDYQTEEELLNKQLAH